MTDSTQPLRHCMQVLQPWGCNRYYILIKKKKGKSGKDQFDIIAGKALLVKGRDNVDKCQVTLDYELEEIELMNTAVVKLWLVDRAVTDLLNLPLYITKQQDHSMTEEHYRMERLDEDDEFMAELEDFGVLPLASNQHKSGYPKISFFDYNISSFAQILGGVRSSKKDTEDTRKNARSR